VRQIFPVSGPELELIPAVTAGPTPAAIEQLAALYRNGLRRPAADRPWLRANMISSADGAATLGGRSGALGGPADRMVFGVLRSLADVILVGAGTARAEKYRPVSRAGIWAGLRDGQAAPLPAIAVVSASLDLSGCEQLLAGGPEDGPTIVITTEAGAKRARSGQLLAAAGPAAQPGQLLAAAGPAAQPGQPRAAAGPAAQPAQPLVLAAGPDRVDPGRAVAALAELGYRQILAEGGPHLLGQLADAGLIDELCLTTSPVLAAGPGGRIVVSADPAPRSQPTARLSLAHVLTDAGFLLSRYIRASG
jgi:riboflavin biosynthesis pyrimidine reductase